MQTARTADTDKIAAAKVARLPADVLSVNYSSIKIGGIKNYEMFKEQLISDFNALHIEGMPEITKLYTLNGAYVNLAYPMPNGYALKLLDDNGVYLGTQVDCEFNGGSLMKGFRLVAGMDFLLVSEYDENCSNP